MPTDAAELRRDAEERAKNVIYNYDVVPRDYQGLKTVITRALLRAEAKGMRRAHGLVNCAPWDPDYVARSLDDIGTEIGAIEEAAK